MTTFPALEEAQGKLTAARKSLKSVFDEAGTAMDLDRVKSISGDRTEKLAWIRTKNTEINGLAEEVKGYREVADAADSLQTDDGPSDYAPRGGFKSVGAEFLKSYRSSGKERVLSVDVETKDLFERTDGWGPESTRSGRIELQPVAPDVQVTDFLPHATINQASYKYMLESTFSVSATEIAEGATFPEADLALTEQSLPVEKVAVWIPVTDEQLEDEPAAKAYIDMRLRYMLARRLDTQLINGNGTSPNLSGTLDQAGINNVVNAVVGNPLIDSLGTLFLAINENGFTEPNVAFVTPTELDLIRKAKTADGQYIWAHPSVQGPATVWGVPLKALFGVLPAGTRAVVGDYAHYSLLAVKRGIDMQVTNSHSTHFIEGKQAIRADMRCVAVHFRPKAFGSITTT